jgi:hypothetical protein
LAEKEGFEPPVVLPTTVFKTAAIDRSAISPARKYGKKHFKNYEKIIEENFFGPRRAPLLFLERVRAFWRKCNLGKIQNELISRASRSSLILLSRNCVALSANAVHLHEKILYNIAVFSD